MAGTSDAIRVNGWGEKAEKQLGEHKSWKEQMYLAEVPKGYGRFRELLEKYSKIPSDEVEARILEIRDKAWEIVRYPCIGHFTYIWLNEFDGNSPAMQSAIERLKDPGSQDTFLELGGFIFQAIRRLVYEGVDSARFYGTDLHPEFIDLGYEQFRDRETLKATMVAGDLLLPDAEYAASEVARALNGKISIAHASNFFHLFTWESQLIICERIVGFFRRGLGPEKPAVLFGRHRGSIKPRYMGEGVVKSFLHNEETFQSLWDEVGKKTGTAWKVSMQVSTGTPPPPNAFGEHSRVVSYVVRQIA